MAGNKKNNASPVMAAVKGAIIGGIAVAGAMTLADEKKREKIKDALVGAKDKTVDYVNELKEKVEDKKEAVADSAESIKGSIEKAAEDIKDAV